MTSALLEIASTMKKVMGLDSNSIGLITIERIVARRMREAQVESLETYAARVKESPEERATLLELLVIPESWFMREKEFLRTSVQLAAKAPRPNEQFRVLSLPCARGEEAYSLAIALFECGILPSECKVVGVDISVSNIEDATRGVFNRNSLRGVDSGLLERYFTPEKENNFSINQAVRDYCSFQVGNALDPLLPSLGLFQLICCRNLLIYLDAKDQARVLQTLHSMLTPHGILTVASAESPLLQAVPQAQSVKPWNCVFSSRSLNEPISAPKKARRPKAVSPRPRHSPPPKIGNRAVAAPLFSPSEARKLADQGNLEAAQGVCQALLRTNPTLAEAHFLLGVIADAKGDTATARESYRRVLYLEPGHEDAALALSFLCAQPEESTLLRKRAAQAFKKDQEGA